MRNMLSTYFISSIKEFNEMNNNKKTMNRLFYIEDTGEIYRGSIKVAEAGNIDDIRTRTHHLEWIHNFDVMTSVVKNGSKYYCFKIAPRFNYFMLEITGQEGMLYLQKNYNNQYEAIDDAEDFYNEVIKKG